MLLKLVKPETSARLKTRNQFYVNGDGSPKARGQALLTGQG
jgi:hypothetical protein